MPHPACANENSANAPDLPATPGGPGKQAGVSLLRLLIDNLRNRWRERPADLSAVEAFKDAVARLRHE